MKLILAQGNPGKQYSESRHNVGFLAIDHYREQLSASAFQSKAKFHADICEFSHHDEKVILAKPTTFYNETGKAARQIIDFYQISSNDVLVIHDELALDFGTLRVRSSGSDAGNKGIRSLISHIGPDFWRVRIGIGHELAERMDSADFVLSRLSSHEKKTLTASLFPDVDELLTSFLDGTIEVTSKRLVS